MIITADSLIIPISLKYKGSVRKNERSRRKPVANGSFRSEGQRYPSYVCG